MQRVGISRKERKVRWSLRNTSYKIWWRRRRPMRSSTGQLYNPAPRRVLSISRFAPATHQHEYSLFDDISLLVLHLSSPFRAQSLSATTSPRATASPSAIQPSLSFSLYPIYAGSLIYNYDRQLGDLYCYPFALSR